MRLRTLLKARPVLVCVGTAIIGAGAAKAALTLHADPVAAASKPGNGDDASEGQDQAPGMKLKMVQIFFRHGARTPIHTIPKIEEAIYPEDFFMGKVPHTVYQYRVADLDGGPRPFSSYEQHLNIRHHRGGSRAGTLTSTGQEQMYLLGKELKETYINQMKLIDPAYSPDQVYARSTNIHRTIESARCVLAGMFGQQNLNNLEAEPTIYVNKNMEDELLPRPGACKVLRQINHAAMIHGGDLPGIKEDRLLLEKIIGIESDKNDKKLNFIDVRDDLVARKTHGLPLPASLTPHWDMIQRNAVKLIYYSFCGQHEAERVLAIRLSTGPLLQLALDNIGNGSQDSPKLHLYSCHDSSLMGVLGALDLYEEKWPGFGANVRFELYEDEHQQQFVKVMNDGKDVLIRGCKEKFCPVEDFKKTLQPYCIRLPEFTTLCKSNILERIAKDLVEGERGEIEDEDSKERSDTAAGM